jgi:Caspase domain
VRATSHRRHRVTYDIYTRKCIIHVSCSCNLDFDLDWLSSLLTSMSTTPLYEYSYTQLRSHSLKALPSLNHSQAWVWRRHVQWTRGQNLTTPQTMQREVLSASTVLLHSSGGRCRITRRMPFFALLIGIDDYATVSRLSGATADADDMDNFLRNHLSVPKGHITNLRNETATREGIIQAFRKLQSNLEIKRDDAIFIYFAGHGSETDAPAGWPAAGSKIQVLLPQDVDVAGPSRSPIPPIPDRTLAALLNDLAREKGNNIVSLCSRNFLYNS